jgi:membrane protease subunit HflC
MSRLISILVAAVVVLMLVSSSMFAVDQHRYAVVYAMGELREVIAEPGLHFKLPAPFQSVVYLDKRLQTLDSADTERFPTADRKDVVVDAFVKWKIVDARQYLIAMSGQNVDPGGNGGAGRGNERIAQVVRTALGAEIARRNVQDLVAGQRTHVAEAVRQRIATDARQLGVEVADMRLKRIGFAEPMNAAVIDRMKAERVRVAAELRATGTSEGETIRSDAERQRSVILAEAQRDAESIRGDGDARAAQIYAQSFGKNPEFYRFYRSMEAYKATFKGRSDILVLDSNSEFFKYFKGPGAGK